MYGVGATFATMPTYFLSNVEVKVAIFIPSLLPKKGITFSGEGCEAKHRDIDTYGLAAFGPFRIPQRPLFVGPVDLATITIFICFIGSVRAVQPGFVSCGFVFVCRSSLGIKIFKFLYSSCMSEGRETFWPGSTQFSDFGTHNALEFRIGSPHRRTTKNK